MNYILIGYLFPSALSLVLLIILIRLIKRINVIANVLYKQEKKIQKLEQKQIIK